MTRQNPLADIGGDVIQPVCHNELAHGGMTKLAKSKLPFLPPGQNKVYLNQDRTITREPYVMQTIYKVFESS